ncbi:MAG: L-lactate dehydrogenase [Eubacteriales bacterium]|nr:L-lactate dehydrogenase [Eubacteriales bacterium]
MNKITIIGAGKVGSTIAYTLSVMNLAKDIVMIDINHELALGEALDIRQGTPFSSNCSVYAGDYPDAANSNIVVITSGVARKPGQSRLELAQTNVNIMKSIMPQVTKYAPDAMYIIVSNPVDILTYQWCKRSGLPENHIIGSGTILDTARLKARLSEYYNISQSNVHAYVFGEHGDSSFVPWSLANISNIPVTDFRNKVEGDMSMAPELNTADVEQYIRKSGGRVIARKGATFYAVAVSVCHICKCLLDGMDTTLTVSTMMHGEYGIEDVCLSVLNTVGWEGVHSKLLAPLTEEETGLLRHSADVLKDVISNLDI